MAGYRFLFSEEKFRVSVPENLRVLKDHDDRRRVKVNVQACWGSLRMFNFYQAITDHRIDWQALYQQTNCRQRQISIKRQILDYPFANIHVEERVMAMLR